MTRYSEYPEHAFRIKARAYRVQVEAGLIKRPKLLDKYQCADLKPLVEERLKKELMDRDRKSDAKP